MAAIKTSSVSRWAGFALALLGTTVLAILPQAASANTAGGARIHNTAKLTFSGGSPLYASIDVDVITVAAIPTITVDTTSIAANTGDSVAYTYTITNTSNGSDTLNLSVTSTDTGLAAAPTFDLNGGGGTASSVLLGGSISSVDSDAAGNVYIPAGSENNLQVGDTIVIDGVGTYIIATLTPGTQAFTTAGVTTAEVPTSMTLTPVGAGPAIVAGTVAAGTQIGEQVKVTLDVTVPATTTAGVNGTSTIDLTGTTTAVDTSNSTLTFGSNTPAGASYQTVLTVATPTVVFLKEVRNVTRSGSFAQTGVTAQTGDILEYRLNATPVAGTGNVNNAAIVEEVPNYTSYVAGTTKLNGVAVADGPASTLPTTSANGGLQVNSPSGAAGVIVDGESAVILYQVTIN